MKHNFKRFLSLVLAMVMVFSMFTGNIAYAAEGDSTIEPPVTETNTGEGTNTQESQETQEPQNTEPVVEGDDEPDDDSFGGLVFAVVNGSAQVTDGKAASGDIVIPESVTIDGSVYPVTAIAANAFNDANEVTSVVVPNSVTTLGGAAFANMDKLKSITIGNGVTSWGSKLAVNNYELETVVIAEGATLIGDLAFRTCPKLANLTLPSTLKTIGATAFAYAAITELNIPASVDKIGADAFKDIDTLKKVTFNSVPTNLGTTVFQMCDGLEEVVLPEGLTVIPQGTFRYCTALKTINFPASLTEIGNYSFQGCTSLETVTISKNITNLVTNAFNGCTSLKNLTIEEGFAGTIGGYVFQGCTALESVVIPSSMETVGESMFNMCYNLKDVTISEGVKTLNISAFANCTSLETLTLPDSLERMRHGSIANCTALKELVILGENLPTIEHSNALDGISNEMIIVYSGDDAFTGNWSAVADNLIISNANAVAVVGTDSYETLKDAVAAANTIEGGATITLLSDVTLGEKLTISGDVTISGAYTITRDAAYTGTLFTVNAGATLTLDGGLVIDGGNEWTYKNGKIAPTDLKYGGDTYLSTHVAPETGAPVATDDMFDNYGTLYVNQATVQNSYTNSAVSVFFNQENASIVLNGAVIKRNVSCEDGVVVAVDNPNGLLTITGNTVITENIGASNGGIIHVYGKGSIFSMEGGRIEGNYVVTSNSNNSSGTVICSYSGSSTNKNTVKLSGGVITNNHAEGYGTLYIHSNTVFEMSGGEVSNNTSYYPCYARSSGNETTITGGKITNNWVAASSYQNYSDIYSTSPIAISGGTFTQDVTDYLAPDCKLDKNDDGTFGVKEDPTYGKVAKVGEEYYETLAAAIDAASADDTITLLDDVNLTSPLSVPAGKTVVLDLNGKTVTYNSTVQGEAMITNKGTLTINDTVGGGVINYNYTGAADPYYGKGNYTISNAGTLTVNGGKITIANLRSHAKYPIDNNSTTGDAILVIKGGHLYNYNTSAIRQFCNSTTYKNSVTINGGLIEGYCAIWVQNPGSKTVNGALSITGGEIRTTAAAYENGSAELKDVSSRIYCTTEGGAWSEDSLVSITGGTINENVALIEEAPADITIGENATFNGYVEAPKPPVAKIGEDKYETLAEAVAAANAIEGSATITLLTDIELSESIKVNGNVTLDLNGKTIAGTDNATASFGLIEIQPGAELTVADSSEANTGKITLNATNDRYTNAYSSVISNQRGKLTVEGGTIEHLGGTYMAYGIDNLTNGKGTYAETIINGGTIKSTYRGIRQFLNGVEAQNILTVNGGTIEGANKSIWMQDPNKNANSGTLTVSENAALNGDVYLFVTAGSTEWPVEVSIAASAVNGEVLTGNVPEGYEIQTVNGTIGVVKAMVEMDGVYYATIKDALWTLSSADTTVHTVKVLQDLDIDVNYSTFNYPILVNGFSVILDLNGKTITADWSKYTGSRMDNALIGLANGGKLTITGNGTIRNMSDGKDDVENRIFWLSNAHATKQEILTIENGTFIQEEDIHLLYVEGVPSNQQKAGYFTYINGGHFQMVGYNDFFNSYDGRKHETVISGGTFNFDPTDNELKISEGFKTEEIADGVWGIVEMKVAQIGTKTYGTLAAAVEAAQPGQTIKLLQNASGAGVVIDKNLNINFNGFTYTLTEGVGSTGTESNGFQILAGNTVTLRSGTLKVADSAADKFYILVQNYANLNLLNMILDGTNLDKYAFSDGDSYTLSNNSGYVALSGTTIIANDDGDKAFAFDACDKTAWGYELPTVVVNSTSKIQGNIEAVAQIGTKYYATLQQAVDVAAAGAKIILVRDSAGAGVVIDKDITILFGKHTYTLTEGVGSTGTESNGFQILNGNNVTLQNGTLKVADSAADKFYILVQNYANLIVNNMILDGTNLDKWSKTDGDSYTLSNNSGNVSIGGTTEIIANNEGDKAFAFDVCKFANYEEPVVSVATTAKITGAVEAAAKVGNKYYATLQAAIDAAANGKTVTLMKNIEVDAADAVKTSDNLNVMFKVEGKNLTLDMNGKTIKANYDSSELLYAVVYVADGASLTVKGEGTIDLTTGDTKADTLDCVAYMFWKRGTTGALTIENGTYTANKVEDSMIYTNSDKIVNVKGGTWTLENVDTKANGSPWIFNTKGQNAASILVSGGTYNFNVAKQFYAHEAKIVDAKGNLSYVIDNGNGTWTVTGLAAEVGIITPTWKSTYLYGYATFKDAVASIAKGAPETTIVLQKDITVKGQFIGHSYAQDVIIDLNGYKMSSTDKALTVYRSGTDVTIKNGTVHGNTTGGTIQVTYGGKLTLGENTTITCGGSANALKVDANSTLIIADDSVKVQGGKNDLIVADGAKVEISAGSFKYPVKAEWCAEGYIPTEKLANGYYSVMKDPAYGMAAKAGDNYYETLAAAIEAAENNDTVTLLTDIEVSKDDLVDLDGNYTFFKVEGKAITVDLNGKTIYADASAVTDKYVVGVFSTTNGGKLTLTGNGTVQGYSGASQEAAYLVPAKGNKDYNYKFYTLLIAYDEECLITVENGTYSLDYSGDSLIYSSCNEGVIVNGGTFTLGNLGGIRNGMPWIFNARGQNQRHVIVNGGSFCADIQHQYYPFEVQVAKELALSKNDGGMYTIVPAVAYVTEREWSSAWYTNEVGYATLEEAIAACEGPKTRSGKTSEQEEVVLLKDIALENTLTIPSGKNVVLNLNNQKINGTNSNTATHNDLFLVKGNLTVKNGTVNMTHTGTNMGWNGCTNVFDVTAGGVLNIDNATVANLGGTDMNFGVHLNNWGEVTLNVTNSTISGTYCAVRVFNSGFDMNNVTIQNSALSSGGTRAFWVHNYIGDLDANKHSDAAINARLNLDIYGNGNTFTIEGTATSPIRYGFGKGVYFDVNGNRIVSDAADLKAAAANGDNVVLANPNVEVAEDITVAKDSEFLMNSASAIDFNGNSNTIITNGTGTEPGESYDYGYVGFIPANGEDAVVSNVKVVGSGFVEVGHHGVSTGGNYSITNLIIDKLNATLAVNNGGNNIAAAFSHYGNATMTNCVMTGTTTAKDGYKPYDAAFVNGTKTTIIGGKFDNVYLANQAHVTITGAEIDVIDSCAITAKELGNLTIGAGTKVGTINLTPGKYTPALVIEDGAQVDAIVYSGVTYTVAEWLAR